MPRLLKAFKDKWALKQPKFYAYFDKEWLAQLKYKDWIRGYREGAPNTTGMLESYHGVIKMLFTTTRCVVLQVGFTSGFYKRARVLQVQRAEAPRARARAAVAWPTAASTGSYTPSCTASPPTTCASMGATRSARTR